MQTTFYLNKTPTKPTKGRTRTKTTAQNKAKARQGKVNGNTNY